MTVVTAPAGYGKTTAARWLAATRVHATAWVSIGSDDDRAGFWQKVWPAVEGLDGLLVVDDLHRANDPVLFEELARFVDRLPAQLRLLVTTRRRLPLPFGRWRAQDRVAELGVDDLRLEPDEAGAFAGPAGGDVQVVRAVAERAEGWPLGIEILAGAEDPQQPLDAVFAAVLADCPTDVEEFLLATSILDELGAEVCASVAARADAGRVLDEIEAAHLFVVPLDVNGSGLRYHRLFREFLQAELGRRQPGTRARLHTRAAEWFQTHGDLRRAVAHLVEAGEIERAFWLTCENIGLSWERTGDGPLDATGLFPVDWLNADVLRMVYFATALGRHGDLSLTDTWLSRAEMALARSSNAEAREGPRRAVLDAARALWLAAYGHVEAVVDLARRADGPLTANPELAPLRDSLALVTINAHIAVDAITEAEASCDNLDGPQSSEFVRGVAVPGYRARLALRQGRLRLAEELGQQSLSMARTLGVAGHPVLRQALVAVAGVQLERGDASDVESMVETARDLVAGRGWLGMAAQMQIELARVRAAIHGPTAGLQVVEESRRSLEGEPAGPELLLSLDATEARIRLDAGDLAAAEALIESLGSGNARHVLRLCLALARHNGRAAAGLLVEMDEPRCPRDHVVGELLTARVAALLGQRDRDSHLVAAANAAVDEGFCRIFRADATELLPALRLLAQPGSSVTRLLASLDALSPAPSPASQVVGTVTDREIAVLLRLQGSLTISEIAAQLGVSANTVKTQTRTLYRKLGVRTRADAVAAGRRRMLL